MSVLQRLFSAKSSTAKLPTSTEIEAELNQERLVLTQAEPVLATLIEKRRRMLLVDSSPKDLDQVESEISAATRTRDRAGARVEALETAFAEAVERENQAEIRKIYDTAVAKIERARTWQRERYQTVAQELADGFKLLIEADELAESDIQVPPGAEPLMGPSFDRHTANLSHQAKLYADTRKLQALDPGAELLWRLPYPMTPY